MAKRANKPETNGSETPPGPAYFTSLTLENLRCFREKQTLKMDDGKGGPARWTILLGENGTGKTTVLQALAIVEWKCRRKKDTMPPFPYRFDATTLQRRPDADAKILVGLTETGFGSEVASSRTHSPTLLVRHDGGITESELTAREDVALPLLCAYGAGRRLEALLEESTLDEPAGTLFSSLAELRDAEKWLLRLDYAASKPSTNPGEQERRRDAITTLLLKILPEGGAKAIRFVAGEGTHPKPRVEFLTPYGWVPLRSLGYGYQTLIAWMVDLASRMAECYPDSPDPLAEPAIVLVDEIDLHLHPKWQRQLVGELTRRFPQTQFIVTAHSPLVVQAAEDANLAVLRRDGDQVVIDNDVDQIRNWRLDQIYTSELFGLPSARPPRLDALMKRREEILSKPKLTEADEKELATLDREAGDIPVGDSAAEARLIRTIQESIELLQKGAGKP